MKEILKRCKLNVVSQSEIAIRPMYGAPNKESTFKLHHLCLKKVHRNIP